MLVQYSLASAQSKFLLWRWTHDSQRFVAPLADSDRFGALLSTSIFEAHTRTSLLTREQIQEQWKSGVDQAKLFSFKSMTQEGLWLQAAERLTSMITQIIEFAKMLPGFMKFLQDDQIVLLKGGEKT